MKNEIEVMRGKIDVFISKYLYYIIIPHILQGWCRIILKNLKNMQLSFVHDCILDKSARILYNKEYQLFCQLFRQLFRQLFDNQLTTNCPPNIIKLNNIREDNISKGNPPNGETANKTQTERQKQA